jgi:hypothetical protein
VNSFYEVREKETGVALSADHKNTTSLKDSSLISISKRAKLIGNTINIEASDAAYLDELMKQLILLNYPRKLARRE